MNFAGMIDHTLLKPEASKEQVKKLCQEAVEYGFHSVCVNSSFVYYCASLLKGSAVKVCTVIGFPLGAMSTAGKAAEARAAVADGAFSSVEEAAERLVQVVDTVEPDPRLAAKYEERYRKFAGIYPAVKELFGKL